MEDALKIFVMCDPHMYRLACGRLRVLLTKIKSLWKPPFVVAEVVSFYHDISHLAEVLRASCHVPLAAGIKPYTLEFDEELAEFTSKGRSNKPYYNWYIDGLVWFSFLVPWRTFHKDDKVIKVSAVSLPSADISPRRVIPPWWGAFPPSEEILWGLFWSGYMDVDRFFKRDPHSRASNR